MEELDGFRDDDEDEEEEGLGFFLGRIGFRLGLFSLPFSASSVSATPHRESGERVRKSVCFTVSFVLFMRFYCFFVVWDLAFPAQILF